MADTSEVTQAVYDAAHGEPMGWAARVGLLARGIVYVLLGWLAILIAQGAHVHVDQRGALTEVVAQPFGTVVVALIALGFAAYAVWRISEALVGVTGEGDGAGPRLKSLARGVAYAALAITAVSVLMGSHKTQAGQEARLAAAVMQNPAGRWLVGLVGLGVVAVGLALIREGWSKRFLRYFGYLSGRRRDAVVWLGRIGTVARGIVFAITGALVGVAAVTADPRRPEVSTQPCVRYSTQHSGRSWWRCWGWD